MPVDLDDGFVLESVEQPAHLGGVREDGVLIGGFVYQLGNTSNRREDSQYGDFSTAGKVSPGAWPRAARAAVWRFLGWWWGRRAQRGDLRWSRGR